MLELFSVSKRISPVTVNTSIQKQLQQSQSVQFQNTNRINQTTKQSVISQMGSTKRQHPHQVHNYQTKIVPQKRQGSPLTSSSASSSKQRILSYNAAVQVTRPPMAKDVKFPVVTHKEIQVEIVPSDRGDENVDYYEIEFKGRKTPNKYNVKPSIKIVKLIGLQSDTNYLIKVFAVRKSSECFLNL